MMPVAIPEHSFTCRPWQAYTADTVEVQSVHADFTSKCRQTNLVLLLAQKGLVGVNELQVGGGGDVHMTPLLGEEALAQGLHALMEQHAQLWHLSADLHHNASYV